MWNSVLRPYEVGQYGMCAPAFFADYSLDGKPFYYFLYSYAAFISGMKIGPAAAVGAC